MELVARFKLSEKDVVGLTLCPVCTEDLREETLASWVAHGMDKIKPFRVKCPSCCRMYKVYPRVEIMIDDMKELPEEYCERRSVEECLKCITAKQALERGRL